MTRCQGSDTVRQALTVTVTVRGTVTVAPAASAAGHGPCGDPGPVRPRAGGREPEHGVGQCHESRGPRAGTGPLLLSRMKVALCYFHESSMEFLLVRALREPTETGGRRQGVARIIKKARFKSRVTVIGKSFLLI